jgi:hypothetical protein
MRIQSEDIPQADVLDDVVRTVEAVGSGARTFADIARALGKVDRQGRYYRKAAEILGFIRNDNNRSVVTARGRAFLDNPPERAQRLAEAVLKSRLIQRVIPYLESKGSHGVSRAQMESFIEEVTDPVGASMIPRRVSTVLSWLERIGMVREHKGRYSLRGRLPAGVDIVEYDAPDEPLFPKKYALDEYKSVAGKVREAKGYINVLIDDAARERAEDSHRMLTELVAAKVRAASSIPKSNRYVDLSAVIRDDLYLFEMKSTTDNNVHSQIRRAISQLYEYRYLQEVPAAKLVVVIENPPPQEKKWIVDYVVNDRKLLIAWDGDRKTLQCPTEIGADLRFLT